MPAFRNAQTAGGGLLPNDKIPASFVAQAFDAAEPAGGDEVRTCLVFGLFGFDLDVREF